MLRSLLLLLATVALASAAEKKPLLGQVQPEIRLSDGTVFKQARIVAVSPEQATATVAEATRIRTVALDQLPPRLRDQLLAEAGVAKPKSADPRPRPLRPLPAPAQPPAVATPPVATTAPATRDQLLQAAAGAAPDQLKARLTRTYGQVGSFTTKVLETAEVPGWPRIRVSGETTFTERTPGRPASQLRRERFEVEFALTASGGLQPLTVTVGGLSETVPP